MLPSIFNDVIGPVMRGPSSSHCAAALRIGRLARDLVGGKFDEVLVEFDRAGSLPTTHESQGSDMGLFGGLLGWDAADDRLPNAGHALRDAGVRVRIETVDELKAKLASVVILFVAIAYVKLLVEWRNPVETLLFGAATGILIAVLIQYYKAKEGHGE